MSFHRLGGPERTPLVGQSRVRDGAREGRGCRRSANVGDAHLSAHVVHTAINGSD